jgi:hypothetical protein
MRGQSWNLGNLLDLKAMKSICRYPKADLPQTQELLPRLIENPRTTFFRRGLKMALRA